MAAQGLAVKEQGQLELYGRTARRPAAGHAAALVCAGCRAREARYGFREEGVVERPRTLCFECFRMELEWRQRAAAQLARGWNAEQVRLPLAERLNALSVRRRRAQIAARRAIGA